MSPSRKAAARDRVLRSRKIGDAAREIDLAVRGLDNLVTAGARHMGGHRSGKRWVDDVSNLALGYWEDVAEVQAGIAWDLGASLPEGHPFAPVVDGKHAA